MYFNKEEVLKIIHEKPYNSIKLFALKDSFIVESMFFTTNWNLFNFLENMVPSNKIDTVVISSKSKPVITDIKNFLDGRMLKALFIILHDENKIPSEIFSFINHKSNLKTFETPFFLFKEHLVQTGKTIANPAAAFFTSKDTSSIVAENTKLAEDAGFNIVHKVVLNNNKSGKTSNQIVEHLKNIPDINTVLLFYKISPSEISELEKLTGLEILSREDIIITIFNERADSTSGKLKLAGALIAKEKKQYRKKVTGLSRIKGGIGLKGPGETKEEERKRILKKREKVVRLELSNEFSRLSFQRKYRLKSNFKTVAIVGYTNAGKSTLFNSILNLKISPESNIFFSSIDPKIKKISLFGKPVYLIDTVGLISNMTDNITDPFKATFYEIANSDMVLHIVDSTLSDWSNKSKMVEKILISNGTPKENFFTLFSKSDLIKIKHPVTNGFFFNSFNSLDILRIKKFIYNYLFNI